MPNIKSAKKRLRQNIERRARNRADKSEIKTAIRKYRETAAKDVASAEQLLPSLYKLLDQAAAKGVIHANKSSRTKSRLAHVVVKSKQAAQ
jgi:small subunit ribosomal protein S20